MIDYKSFPICYNGAEDKFYGENLSNVIYVWTEIRDGAEYPCYVGQTIGTINERVDEHLSHPTEYLFQRKLRKRPKNFKCYCICSENDQSLLNIKETEYILHFNTFHDHNKFGYNLTLGGSNGKKSEVMKQKVSKKLIGRKFSEETLKKMSISHMGKSPSNKGKSPSEKTRQIWSKQRRGRKVSEETKRKMSLSISGEKHPFYGKTHTDESRIKISKNKPTGTSGVRGVRVIEKNGKVKYIAQQRYNNTMKYLGSFYNIEDAKNVVNEFRRVNSLYGC